MSTAPAHKGVFRSIYDSLFFNEILLIFLETNLELFLASVLNLKCEFMDPDCTVFNRAISWSIIIIVTIIVPITIIYVLYKIKTKQNTAKFNQRWGVIFEDYKQTSLSALSFKLW